MQQCGEGDRNSLSSLAYCGSMVAYIPLSMMRITREVCYWYAQICCVLKSMQGWIQDLRQGGAGRI